MRLEWASHQRKSGLKHRTPMFLSGHCRLSEHLGTIGIENDNTCGGGRTVMYERARRLAEYQIDVGDTYPRPFNLLHFLKELMLEGLL